MLTPGRVDFGVDPDLLQLGGHDLARVDTGAVVVLQQRRAEAVGVGELGELGLGLAEAVLVTTGRGPSHQAA